jgi:TonB family protein
MTLNAAVPLLVFLAKLGASFAQDSAPVLAQDKPDDKPTTSFTSCLVSNVPGCTNPPRASHSPDPKFPKKERKAGHQGTVLLFLIVSPEGLPHDIKVLSTLSPEFDEAAMDAVKKWKFSPATKDGKPVAAKINVQVNFHLY